MVIACALSIVLGGLFGMIAAVGMGMWPMAVLAFIFGAVAGLVTCPVLIFGLWHGPMLPGLVWIVMPTTVAAFVGGALTPSNGGPLFSMVVAISVYVLTSFVRGIVGLTKGRSRLAGSCAICGYDFAGLAPEVVCPECGSARVDGEQREPAPTDPA